MIKKMFDFEKLDDGWELVRYNYNDDPRITRLEIPAKYKFHKVKSISPKAFNSASFLKSIVVPDCVTSIGAAAFEYCEQLEEITLPRGLKIIDYNMFAECASLRKIELPAKVAVIRMRAFARCVSLEEITLPEMLCVVYNMAFQDCAALKTVRFPDSEVTLLGNTFMNCRSLSAETAMFSLIGVNDLEKPFAVNTEFNWDLALREDVFKLAVEHNSFANISKAELFKQLIDRNLIDYMPLAEGMLNERILGELVDYSSERNKTEFTARLLNCRNGGNSAVDNNKNIEDIINAQFNL